MMTRVGLVFETGDEWYADKTFLAAEPDFNTFSVLQYVQNRRKSAFKEYAC